jgi:hypothetical protein
MHPLRRLFGYAHKHRRDVWLGTFYSVANKFFDVLPELLIGVAGALWFQARLSNNLQGIASVKAFAAEDFEVGHIRQASDDYRTRNTEAIRWSPRAACTPPCGACRRARRQCADEAE